MLSALLLGLLLGGPPPASASDDSGIEVRDAWIRLPPPRSHAAVYLTLTNASGRARTLVAARSDRAERVEIHRSELREGVARMLPVESVTLPAKGELVFEPRGLHLMLIHPKALAVGERVGLELVFESGDPLRFQAEVRRAAPMGHGGQGGSPATRCTGRRPATRCTGRRPGTRCTGRTGRRPGTRWTGSTRRTASPRVSSMGSIPDARRSTRPISVLVLAAIVTTTCVFPGCRGFREAYETRVCWEGVGPFSWNDPTQLQCDSVAIELECSETIEVARLSPEAAARPLVLQAAPEVESPRVGELFSQNCPPNCIAIFLAGDSAETVLGRDVGEILRRAGVVLQPESGAGSDRLELEIERLDVRSETPGFFDLKITTRARAAFRATRISSAGEVRWSRTWEGLDEIRHAYAALSDYESVLDSAYCVSLQSFAQDLSGLF